MASAIVREEVATGASYRRPGEAADTYRIWAEGLVLRVMARGLWDVAMAERYTSDINRCVGEMRRLRPQLRVVVDRSDVPIMAADAHEILLATHHNVLRAGDRVAIIVDSSLAKGQVRRLADREETQSFLSLSAARTWLLAYD